MKIGLSLLPIILIPFLSANIWAESKRQLGIQGQPAPELAGVEWVDASGKKTDPEILAGYRGKVVYLLFFQDW